MSESPGAAAAEESTTQPRVSNWWHEVTVRGGLIPSNTFSGMKKCTAFNFDWDDNICFMPSTIVLFPSPLHKDGPNAPPREVGTKQFAEVRLLVFQAEKNPEPQDPEWGQWEIRGRGGSFDHFSDNDPNRNFFYEDLQKAVLGPESKGLGEWQGPSFKSFQYACSNPEYARATSIITARAQSPITMLQGLFLLKQMGYIKHCPPWWNIYGVGNQTLAGVMGGNSGEDPALNKLIIMKTLLDNVNSVPFTAETLVSSPDDPSVHGPFHTWGFSDDDLATINRAKEALGPEVKAGRWTHVKISLMYTGGTTQEHKCEVIRSDGTFRSATTSGEYLSSPMHSRDKY